MARESLPLTTCGDGTRKPLLSGPPPEEPFGFARRGDRQRGSRLPAHWPILKLVPGGKRWERTCLGSHGTRVSLPLFPDWKTPCLVPVCTEVSGEKDWQHRMTTVSPQTSFRGDSCGVPVWPPPPQHGLEAIRCING